MKKIKAVTITFDDDGTTIDFKPEAENPSLPANRVRIIQNIDEVAATIEWAGVTTGYNPGHRNYTDLSIHHTYLERI